MRFVITGATSFLGVELTRYALSMGNEVTAVCRKDSAGLARLGTHPCLKLVHAAMAEYADLPDKIAQEDVFVNLAWEGTGHGERNVVDIQKGNIVHSLEAIKAAAAMGCRLFVEAGSQAEYGTVMERISETMPCHPFSEYGKAKLAVKEQGEEMAHALGMKYLHLRIFSLYGEEDHPWTLVMSSLQKMVRNEPVALSSCTQKWNFLYVKDAAKQIHLLCQHALKTPDYKAEVYHIASKDTRILKEFVTEMHRLSHSKSKLNFGAITPTNAVSLDPDTSKTEAATGFIADYAFNDIINNIICNFKHSESRYI